MSSNYTPRPKGPTVEELKAKCKKLGLSRYSHLNKAGLISFLEGMHARCRIHIYRT